MPEDRESVKLTNQKYVFIKSNKLKLLIFYRYIREFGFTIEHRPIVIDDIIVKGVAMSRVTDCSKETNISTDKPPVEKVTLRF